MLCPTPVGSQREGSVARLAAVLAVHALSNPPLGYCQGFGDLLAPFLQLFEEDWQVSCYKVWVAEGCRVSGRVILG